MVAAIAGIRAITREIHLLGLDFFDRHADFCGDAVRIRTLRRRERRADTEKCDGLHSSAHGGREDDRRIYSTRIANVGNASASSGAYSIQKSCLQIQITYLD
jgi:hypothetical protein